MSGRVNLDERELRAWQGLAAIVELLPNVLDKQLQRDSDLAHFDYLVLMMLAQAPHHTMRMTSLASLTNATLPRLSHAATRLEKRGFMRRFPCPEDGRATNAQLTDSGLAKVRRAAPGHLANVRAHVIDALDPADVEDLIRVTTRILTRLDPDGIYRAQQP